MKVCPCVGVSLCSLCELSGFSGRVGSEVSMGYISSPGVLMATALARGGMEMKGLELKPSASLGFYGHWPSPHSQG